VIEATSGAEGLVLAQVGDLELREFAGRVLDEVAEDIFFVVANEDDLFDVVDFGNGFQTVPDDGMAGDVKERLTCWVSRVSREDGFFLFSYLGNIERQGSKASSSRWATNLNGRCLAVPSGCRSLIRLPG
jgi:SAM-dependent methyltransferase